MLALLSLKCKKQKKPATALLLISLLTLTACDSQTASPLVAIPPVSATVKTDETPKVSLKPLFCDEASPIHWNAGTLPDASVNDVSELLQKPGVTIGDVRKLVGDTDWTVAQAKSLNAIGVKLCGWKGSTK